MKRMLLLLLALALALPALSQAAPPVLSEGWDRAGQGEVQAAIFALSARIGALRAAQEELPEPVRLSGTGSGTHSVTIPFSPSRVTVEAAEGEDVSIEVRSGWDGESFSLWNSPGYFGYAGEFTASVWAEGDWTVTFEPLAWGGPFPTSGKGPYVSDKLYLPVPMAFLFEADAFALDEELRSLDDWKDGTRLSATLGNESDDGTWESGHLYFAHISRESMAEGGTQRAGGTIKVWGETEGRVVIVECDPELPWRIIPQQQGEPAVSHAAVLGEGWEAAAEEDLKAATHALAQLLEQLRDAGLPPGAPIELKGTGPAVITGIDIASPASRVIVHGDAEIMCLREGRYAFDVESEGHAVGVSTDAGVHTAYIDAAGDWSLAIEPVEAGNLQPMAGRGGFVSDRFTLKGDTVLTFEAKLAPDADMSKGGDTFVSVLWYTRTGKGWQFSKQLVSESVDDAAQVVSLEISVPPEHGETGEEHLIQVDFGNGIEWRITPKGK